MAQKIEVEFELKYKEAVKNLDEFQKEYAKLQKQVNVANKKTANSLSAVEKNAKSGATGIRSVTVSIKALAKASGVIFLLQKAFEFVSTAVQENQEVMDGLNVVFNTAQIVFNEVLGAITDVYKSVSSSSDNFDALGKVMGNLITLVINPFKVQFYALKLAFEVVQLAYENMFGDEESIKKVSASIDETKDKLVEIAKSQIAAGISIVTNFVEVAQEIGAIGTTVVEELSKVNVASALETAKANQALEKSAKIAAAQSRILLEQYDRQAELQRQIRDDETKSIAERQAANDKLNTILDKQEEEMTKNALLMKAAAQAQFNLTGKTEDYVAVLEAEAEVQAVAATVTGFRSEQQVNANALTKEATELKNAELESESLLSIEKKRFNAELIEDELLRLERLAEIDLLEAEQETIRLQAIVDNAAAGTQAKVDAQIALDQFTETSRQTNLTRDREIADAKMAMQQEVLDNLISIGGAETKFGQAMLIAKQLLLAKELIMDVKATLFSAKNSATKTVIKSAEAGVEVATGTAKAASAAPFPANIPLIVGYAAQAVGIISAIRSAVKASKAATKGIGGGGGDISAPSISGGSVPPAFNVVGASGETQLADAIGSQTQRPSKSYVVANDVTTAQEMDRNIIEGASI